MCILVCKQGSCKLTCSIQTVVYVRQLMTYRLCSRIDETVNQSGSCLQVPDLGLDGVYKLGCNASLMTDGNPIGYRIPVILGRSLDINTPGQVTGLVKHHERSVLTVIDLNGFSIRLVCRPFNGIGRISDSLNALGGNLVELVIVTVPICKVNRHCLWLLRLLIGIILHRDHSLLLCALLYLIKANGYLYISYRLGYLLRNVRCNHITVVRFREVLV